MIILPLLMTRVDRLPYMEYLVKRWNGPFSIAIFMTDGQIDEVDAWLLRYNHIPHLRVTLYLIDREDGARKQDIVFWSRRGTLRQLKQSSRIYPINVLRDVAILNCQTTHYINLDMDLWPTRSFYLFFWKRREIIF